jgi:thiamine biosynthesis protein ThiS
MIITLNNQSESFDQEFLNITELLEIKKFTFKALVVKINGLLVRKHEYQSTVIHSGDNVDVIHLISGG